MRLSRRQKLQVRVASANSLPVDSRASVRVQNHDLAENPRLQNPRVEQLEHFHDGVIDVCAFTLRIFTRAFTPHTFARCDFTHRTLARRSFARRALALRRFISAVRHSRLTSGPAPTRNSARTAAPRADLWLCARQCGLDGADARVAYGCGAIRFSPFPFTNRCGTAATRAEFFSPLAL